MLVIVPFSVSLLPLSPFLRAGMKVPGDTLRACVGRYQVFSAHLCHGAQVLGPQRGSGQTGFSLSELTFQSGSGHCYIHNVILSSELCYEENRSGASLGNDRGHCLSRGGQGRPLKRCCLVNT